MTGFPDPLSLVTLIVAFGLAPFAALMVTSYTKLVIVFGILRAALGLQQTPPNMVINGIALILTVYIMTPVALDTRDALRARPAAGSSAIDTVSAVFAAAEPPLKGFLLKHTLAREREFFVRSANRVWPKARAEALKSDDLVVLVPAFALSELTRAFTIGFVLYMVFVVVDLIVATILLALGMSMMAPTTISLPFKLLLFVVLDGWTQLVERLVLSYA
jgi:type III secretion protein R